MSTTDTRIRAGRSHAMRPRWIRLLTGLPIVGILLLAGPVARADNTAEQLFRQMEEKLSKARTLYVISETICEPGNQLCCSLRLERGNKACWELSGFFGGESFFNRFPLLTSDGTRYRRGKDGNPRNVPARLNETLAATVARPGFFLRIILLEQPSLRPRAEDVDFNEQFHASDFKLGEKERVNERDTQVIEYRLTDKVSVGALGARADAVRLDKQPLGYQELAVRLWLDVRTGLPVRRTITGKIDNISISLRESFTRIAVDE